MLARTFRTSDSARLEMSQRYSLRTASVGNAITMKSSDGCGTVARYHGEPVLKFPGSHVLIIACDGYPDAFLLGQP